MAESNSFTGTVSSLRTTYQYLASRSAYSKKIQFACFTKNAFTRVLGAEAFGVTNLTDLNTFSAAKPTGRMIRYDSGVYAFGGAIFADTPTSYFVGRLGSYTPELVEGGDEYKYSWHNMVNTQFIPVADVEDNTSGDINIKMQKMEAMQSKYVEDFNYVVLGHASAPDTGSMGPSVVYSDLPNLISYTQTRTVGGISKTSNTYWNNGAAAITAVGGGGDLDRPLILRRKLIKRMNTTMTYAESTGPQDYLLLGTQGFHQYYDRLQYADGVSTGKGDFGVSSRYDAAGVQAHALNGAAMIWDAAVTVPYGATAATECLYGIHIPNFGVAIRKEQNFLLSGDSTGDMWEKPREHDSPKTLVSSIRTRFTPFVTAMRPHWVAYNIPACPD